LITNFLTKDDNYQQSVLYFLLRHAYLLNLENKSSFMKTSGMIIAIILTFSVNSAQGQQSGSVEIHADPRIDALIKKQGSVNAGANSPQIPGFRVQLSFDPDRKTIDEARARFESAYPNIDSYVTFNAPNFFLKVGDFRTQLEAEKLKESVTPDFPASFIIKEQVNLPRIEQN